MKKTLLALLFVILPFSFLFAQFVALPNDEFKTFLRNTYPTCFSFDAGSNDFLLDTTCLAIRSEDSLTIQNLGTMSNRVALDPIRYFTSLNYLYAKSLTVTNCPPFPATLQYLVYKSIRGTDLFGLPNGLKYLDCTAGDSITMSSIARFPDSLRYLNCSWNSVTIFPQLSNTRLDTLICFLMYGDDRSELATLRHLPTLPSTLRYLDCSQNALDSLPALPGALEYLDCKSNYYEDAAGVDFRTLTQLPSLPSSLKILICSNNALDDLPPLPNGLVKLDCGYTHLGQHIGITVLPSLPSSLVYLTCSQNSLTSLPPLPSGLEYLYIGANDISLIDRFPDSLRYFYANANHNLTSIPAFPDHLSYLSLILTDLTCLPHLPASMGGSSQYNSPTDLNFFYNSNKIRCLPNLVNGIRTNQTGVLCTVVNNSNQCQMSPVVTGKVFYDLDGDGVKGSNEMYKSNVRLVMNNSLTTASNDSGFYNISADTGSNVLRIYSGSVFSSIPDTFQYHFSSFDTTVFLDIPLTSIRTVDSLQLSLTAMNNARPGFAVHYSVRYENTGSTFLASEIVVDYDETKLVFDSSTNAAISNTSGRLRLSPGNLSPGQVGSFIASFTLDSAAILGDSLYCFAQINSSSFDESVQNAIRIGGSFDPNDKHATPVLSPLQVDDGEFIQYLVRFQNTGTDTAFNVVITDTLSSFLDAGTFEIVNTSHPCKVTRIANTISFEFLNILLPDSNRNERLSHGFARFKIKAVPGIVPNTFIPNVASIYFDYNAPVVTNTATTAIQNTVNCLTVTNATSSATCGQQNGSITITVSGGIPPYMYSINGGAMQATSTFTNLAAGTFNVLVQDANACTYSGTVVVNPGPGTITPTVSIISSSSTVCAGDAVTFTATIGNGGANPQYQWVVNGVNTGANEPALIINPAVTTDVRVQLTSNAPCVSPGMAMSNTINVVVYPMVTAAISIVGNVNVAQGATLISSSTSNGGIFPSYQWQDSTSSHTWTNIASAINSTIDYAPQQTGDGLRCLLTSTNNCTSPAVAFSNVLLFTVGTLPSPLGKIFPNPVSSNLTIHDSQIHWETGEILDARGCKVLRITNPGPAGSDVSLDVSRLPAGVYVIRLIPLSGKPEHIKFVKQ